MRSARQLWHPYEQPWLSDFTNPYALESEECYKLRRDPKPHWWLTRKFILALIQTADMFDGKA